MGLHKVLFKNILKLLLKLQNGLFRDYLGGWVQEYLRTTYGPTLVRGYLKII